MKDGETNDGGTAVETVEAPTTPGIQDRLAEVRARQAKGESILGTPPAETEDAGEAAEDVVEGAAPDGEAEIEEGAPEGDEGIDDGPAELPAGWERTQSGKIKRPNGTWANTEDIAAIDAGKTPPWQVRQDEAPTGEEGAEPEGEGDGTEAEYHKVTLPSRNPESPDEEWEIADPKLAERIRQLNNMAMRGEEVRTQEQALGRAREEIDGQKAELDDVYTMLEVDPVGFILDEVQKPEIKMGILENLLAEISQEQWNQILNQYGDRGYDDPDLRARRAELRAQRLENRQKAHDDMARKKEERHQVSTFKTLVNGWVGQVDERQRRAFTQVATQRVLDHLERRGQKMFRDVEREVVAILQHTGTFDEFGIEPGRRTAQEPGGDAAPGGERSEATAGGGTRPAAPAGQPSGSAARRDRSPVQARRTRTGEQFRESVQRRKEAGVAHGGGGPAPSQLKPPEGQTVAERIAWWRKNNR